MKKKIAYVPLAADILHSGHLNIINAAKKYGDVVVGLLTDKAIAEYKKLPILKYKERYNIVENLKGIKKIVKQDTWDYTEILKKLKPDYLIHGDDWKKGVQKNTRLKAIKTLKKIGGKLIEPKYTKGISSSYLSDLIKSRGITPTTRMQTLRRLIDSKTIVRFLEAHNGLSGIIVENAKYKKNGKLEEFDGIWESSLTDSTAKGKPDTELVDFTSRFSTIEEILEVTTKPIIVDGDSGGKIEHFKFRIKTLERLGVSAIIIEDKIGSKRNSLFGTSVLQKQDTVSNFSKKIKEGKKSQTTDDFMIIARIESLILEKGMRDAVRRAKSYINSGADGIMIHSKNKDGKEIIKFCSIYKKFKKKVPLVVVPSTFSHFSEKKLEKLGVNVVIYANHLLRSAYPSMIDTAKIILKNGRSVEASKKNCMSINEIIKLIPQTN